MSDQEIVRVLAEFMGFSNVQQKQFSKLSDPVWIANTGKMVGPFETADVLPCYLDSYDALAPVWRKVCFNASKSNDGIVIAAMETLRRKYGVQDWGMWFTATPRDYAEALATAILAAKER